MILTSEQVSWGHPDKICDQISDAILTEYLKKDPLARVAVETLIKGYHVVVAGEITASHEIDIEEVVFGVLSGILGNEDLEKYTLSDYLTKQSPDISLGVNKGGAGDQGIIFGYATNETPSMLPIPFVLATNALLALKELNHPLLRPDAKSQVSYNYQTGKIETFLISTQHSEDISNEELYSVVQEVMRDVSFGFNRDYRVLINPTGRFVCGGSFADTGLTGRKIIADSYGGIGRHGGGAFSGKDPTKVDRSAAYMLRKVAKDLVRSGMADRCEIQIAYAIGIAEPVSLFVDCFDTNRSPLTDIYEHIKKEYSFRPNDIIEILNLRSLDYNKVSTYGHFGKSYLPWE